MLNPNRFVPNGLGVSPEPRRAKSAVEQLYDQLDIVMNSLAWFRESGDSRGVADCEDVIRDIRVKIDELVWQRERETHCPVCGLDLTEHPHSESDCAEWFAEDYRDADETRADLWQF